MSTDELTLGTEPDAARRARRLVAAALDGSPLVDDARLVVTELLTNAQLHGEPPLVVRVLPAEGGVRLEVQDASPELPLHPAASPDAMTGRGMALVRALSSGYGVEPGPGRGKTVWAELHETSPDAAPAPPAARVGGRLEEPGDAPLHRVVLGPVPTRLLLEAKRHIDNVVRELALEAGTERPVPAALVAAVTRDFAAARAALKRQAAEAAARGESATDLELLLPASAATGGERYLSALQQADRYARDARLLTLETPPLHKLFRSWYVGTVVQQLRALSAGAPVPPPRPFADVLASEVEALSALRDASHRLQVLQQVTADLAAAEDAGQMGEAVLLRCVEELDALSGRVYVVDGNVLRSVAVAGGSRDGATAFASVPLAADLPGPVALRTGRPVVLRDRVHAEERFPDMQGALNSDRSLHAVPLLAGTHRVGVLSLGLPPDSRVPVDERGAFVQALADVLAQALDRLRVEQVPTPVPELDHAALFRALPTAYMVMDRDLVLVEANDAYLSTVGRTREEILGRGVFEAFPPTEDALESATGVSRVQRSFERARDTGQIDVLPLQRYDIPDPVAGGTVERFWSLISVPLPGPDGRTAFIAQRAEDVTDFVRERERGRRAEHDSAQWRRRVEEVEADLFARGAELEAAMTAQREAARAAEGMSETLQRSLLGSPAELPGADLAVRYRPASSTAQVGGDWYDAFLPAVGGPVVTVGDVAGHDRDAAAAMGQVRNLLRGLAVDSPDGPARLLRRLDAALQGLAPDLTATAVLARLEQRPEGLRVTWSSAGHPPGLVRRPDGSVEVLHGSDLMLGVDPALPRTEQQRDLEPGSTLALFTDGLVERRGSDLDDGLAALSSLLARGGGSDPESTADALLTAVPAGENSDDIALLVLQVR